MDRVSSLSCTDLSVPFVKSAPTGEYVGIEVENAALDRNTGRSVPYEGERGLGAFLVAVANDLGGEPQYERRNIVGIRLPSGADVSLENGGAVEYASTPAGNVAAVVDAARDGLLMLAGIAERFGFALVPGANYPFTTSKDVQWMPNARGEIMRRHFDSLGERSAFGRQVMALTLSTQATFDYSTPRDLTEKIFAQATASTVATALFVNSPLEGGRPCGVLSRRMHYWSRIDPARTGIIPGTLDGTFTIDRFIDWALSLPMIYRKRPDSTSEYVGRPFADLLSSGFADGSAPGPGDWAAHLSQIYTDVRLRGTLETRAVDGPPWRAVAVVPAFWTGLTYHEPSRLAVVQLLGEATLAQHLAALEDIARRGMAASFAGQPVREITAELLRLSEAGLRARVKADLEDESVLSCLNPLWEIVDTGQTFAQRCLHAWAHELRGSPEKYVAAYGIQT